MKPEAMPLDSHSLPAPLSSLSRTATDAMLAAFQRYLEHSADVAPLRAALHTVGREAKVKCIPPERLMIAFKRLWASLPQASSASDTAQQAKLLERLITISIEEYYRD